MYDIISSMQTSVRLDIGHIFFDWFFFWTIFSFKGIDYFLELLYKNYKLNFASKIRFKILVLELEISLNHNVDGGKGRE